MQPPLRLVDPMLERLRERELEPLYRDVELPLTAVLAAMEEAGVKIDTYRMGEITARLAEQVEELAAKAYRAGSPARFMLGSTQQVGRILFEKLGLTLTARARPATRPTHASSERSAASTRSSA